MPKSPKRARDPSATEAHTLERLHARVAEARKGDPATSYTAKLAQRGRAKVAQKLGEEAVETVIELIRDDRAAIIGESADLLYHLMVAWSLAGVEPREVWTELERREGIGGLTEKAARKE